MTVDLSRYRAKDARKNPPPCLVGQALASLRGDDLESLEAALTLPNQNPEGKWPYEISAHHIAAVLTDFGFRMSDAPIRKHRSEHCTCRH